MKFTVLYFDTLDSTNTEALNQARGGAPEGLCIVAAEQTAGRGRHGRNWVSAKGSGLYVSYVLRPKLPPRFMTLITLMAGVAVSKTLEDIGIANDIKWVNDILVNEKKICGILSEAAETPMGQAVIVGIGVNLKSVNFPPGLADSATSIEAEAPSILGLAEILEQLSHNLGHFYHLLQSDDGGNAIIDEWRRRSTYFSGKAVRAFSGGDVVEGTTDGLNAYGALRIRKADGTLYTVHAGDIEKLRPADDLR